MLTISYLHASYGAIKALAGVSIEVKDGECVAIVGSNGAGKTTLLRVISGLLTPANGTITFEGQSLAGKKAYEIAALGIAHVPEGRRVFGDMTVYENLLVGSIIPSAKPFRQKSIEYVFDLFPRLAERRNQLAGTMSGGEQQMLAIARGLMLRPKLLMLDEPSSGLAPIIVEQTYEQLERIYKASKMSMLVVEQNVNMALTIADRGYVLENGEIKLFGSSQELIVNPEVEKAYLGFH